MCFLQVAPLDFDGESSSDTSILSLGKGEAEKSVGISALFSTRTMTKITLVLWVNWIVVTMSFYGISLGIGDVGPDIFINFLLISLVEIPSYVFAIFTIDHLGRKTLLVLSMTLTGVGCLSAAFLEDDSALKTVLSLLGKFGATAAFVIIILFTGELHPTNIRSTAMGIGSAMARIGGIAAPQVQRKDKSREINI